MLMMQTKAKRRVIRFWVGDLALPVILGALTTLAFAPFNASFVNLLTLAAMYELWFRASPGRAFLRGWLFGLGNFATGVYWIYISTHVFGGAPAWLGVFLTAFLVAYLALYPALVGYISARWLATGPITRALLVWPALWTLSELLRDWMFTGFPWLSTGYAWVGTLIKTAGPVVGVFGMSWLVALFAGLLWLLLRAPAWFRPLAAAIGIAIVAAFFLLPGPLVWTHDAHTKPIGVTLIQGNISQARKWAPDNLEPTMERYRELTAASDKSRLLIWPEAAIPALYDQIKKIYFADLSRELKARGQTLLTGMLVRDPDSGRIYNGVIALGMDSGLYLKRHLVPFGEYFPVPGFVRSLMKNWLGLPYDNISAGPWRQSPIMVAGVPVGVSICYEDAFSDDIRSLLPQARLLVNVSNDAWFGDSIAAAQHLQIARMRALETGRPLLRATNTGISATIGPDGSLYGTTPQFKVQRLRATVLPRTGVTPFVRYGNLPLWIATILCCLAGFMLARVRTVAAMRRPSEATHDGDA